MTIYVLIINVIYGIVTIRLSLIRWRLIWSCPVDWASILLILHLPLVRLGNSTKTEYFLVIRGCVLSCITCTPNQLGWCLCLTSLYIFSPSVAKKVVEGACTNGGFWKLHLFCSRTTIFCCFYSVSFCSLAASSTIDMYS